ncbi:MAG: hydroxylamine oxidase, partial [Desulfobacteraceae bacterium]
MRMTLALTVAVLCLLPPSAAVSATAPLSDASQECLDCHTTLHPGIVSGWQASRHAQTTPAAALAVTGLARKVSSSAVPQNLLATAVGCAECHTLRPEAHADTFDHNGHEVHVVVSPPDCATCHSQEAEHYDRNIMAHAHGNLADNALYAQLQQAIIGQLQRPDGALNDAPA